MADFTVTVADADVKYLERLAGDGADYVADSVRSLLEHLARAAADGVRRPGAWERNWIVQATGADLEAGDQLQF